MYAIRSYYAGAITETDAIMGTSGTLTVSDIDTGENVFTPQTDVAGSNGYGTFSIDAAGAWTYTMNSAHDEFVNGVDYTDTVTRITSYNVCYTKLLRNSSWALFMT